MITKTLWRRIPPIKDRIQTTVKNPRGIRKAAHWAIVTLLLLALFYKGPLAKWLSFVSDQEAFGAFFQAYGF